MTRRAVVLRGTPDETAAAARAFVSLLPADDVLWAPPDLVSKRLGATLAAVVLDLHGGLEPDVLGQCHGLIRGGGALVLRLPPLGETPPGAPALAVCPYTTTDVSMRLWGRFERLLAASPAVSEAGDSPLSPPPRAFAGTPDQAAAVSALVELLTGDAPRLVALTADRGRGKSAALGLALRAASASAQALRIAVTSGLPEAAAEVSAFAGPAAGAALWHAPLDLLAPDGPVYDAILVDEAAQLPVPVLKALVLRHPAARFAFATTVGGYEGTGRGFALRFLTWARGLDRGLTELRLETPIRWGPGDPLERLVDDVLLLNAQPDVPVTGGEMPVESMTYDGDARDALAADERLLAACFGLLVQAHYRTTPGDLHRLLDAPNITLHGLRQGGRLVAASLVAREGGLPPDLCARMASGAERIRGHALADTLVSHCGHAEAGALRLTRSVRVAVVPEARRQGLARTLVEHVHAHHGPTTDLFGTLFGATPELLTFRRALGYRLVRLGVSRGERSGEAAAVMVRADERNPAARALVDTLTTELSWSLPAQLELLDAEGALLLGDGLRAALAAALPDDLPPPTAVDHAAAIRRYLSGPQPYEAAAWALRPAARTPAAAARLAVLPKRERLLLTARVLEYRSWREAAAHAGLPTTASAMRLLRPALRMLLSAL